MKSFFRQQRLIMFVFAMLWLFLGCSTASADNILASLFSPQAPAGGTPVGIDLTGITTPSQTGIAGPGYSIAFSSVGSSQGVVQGTFNPGHAVPVAGENSALMPEYLTGGYGSALTTNIALSGNYLSTGVGTITLTFTTPQHSLALLWGSIDVGNSLTFNDAAHFSVTGTDVRAAAAGFVSNGLQGPGGSAYVVVNTDTPFTTVTATSSTISFELAGIATASTDFIAVPAPPSLVLLGTGFGGILVVSLFARCRIKKPCAGRLSIAATW